jgi:REP element-mobilizing transposase RayT
MPNDPRGSGSREVAASTIAELGELHYGRKRVQPHPATVREFQQAAEELLKYSVIRFDSQQVDAIALAFAETITEQTYTCYACAIMPDHAHLVIRKHKHRAERMIDLLQEASRLRLSNEGLIPHDHPCWTTGGWCGFLDSPAAVRRAILYVENNPVKAGFPAQNWKFVTPYNGWPFHKHAK